MALIRKIIRPLVPKALIPQAFRCWVWGVTAWEAATFQSRNGCLPPAKLRFKVSGNPGRRQYIDVGKGIRSDIESALSRVGREMFSFKDILDFGCGCGRTLTYLRDKPAECRLHGTDVDAELIEWCKVNLGFASFSVNDPLPPTAYADNSFDLIYLVSVFTHLNEEFQQQWLAELKRLTNPGGYVLISVHGPCVARAKLPVEQLDALNKNGSLFIADSFWKLYFSGFYQTSFHTPEYIRRTWGDYFEVVDYVERGIAGWHDLVVLKA